MSCIDRRFKIGDADWFVAKFWEDVDKTVPSDLAVDYTWVRGFLQLEGADAPAIQWTTEAVPPVGYQQATIQNTNEVVFPVTAAISATLCVGLYRFWAQTNQPNALLPATGILFSTDAISIVEVYE